MLPWQGFASAINFPGTKRRLALVSSFTKDANNEIALLSFQENEVKIEKRIPTLYPQLKLLFITPASQSQEVALSCGDSLKIWSIKQESVDLISDYTLTNNHFPITSMDWSPHESNMVMCCAADSHAMAVDLRKQSLITSIRPHDLSVYDIAMCMNPKEFFTCSLDGTVRLIDLRDLTSSSIYYQTSQPIMRVSVSPTEENLYSTISQNSSAVIIHDRRSPGNPLSILFHDDYPVSSACWSQIFPKRMFSADGCGCMYASNLSMRHTDVSANDFYLCQYAVDSLSLNGGMLLAVSGNTLHAFKINSSYLNYGSVVINEEEDGES